MHKRDARRIHGVHYTTEALVLRVLRPLFLDKLESRLDAASTSTELFDFLQHLASLTFLDPACGSGNFLVVAYRALREIEARARRKLREFGASSDDLPTVRLDQFHGIELHGEAVAKAREHLEQAALDTGVLPSVSPRIVVGNALRMNWNDVLPANRASFVLGNPPFVGMAWMTPEQQEDRRIAFSFAETRRLRIGRLDYAAGFLAKSIAYGANEVVRFAYVLTNSLAQGEHPRSLGPIFERYGYHVDFAYRPFPWAAEDEHKAKVHVVIVGFSRKVEERKRLFHWASCAGEARKSLFRRSIGI